MASVVESSAALDGTPLERVARLMPGDRVLVHSAGGAIGQAAVALAVRRGARVVATAGSERKRERLRELGAEATFDSRATQIVRLLAGALHPAPGHQQAGDEYQALDSIC